MRAVTAARHLRRAAAAHSVRAVRTAAAITCGSSDFDYLREILNSRVYDVAVETPLQEAHALGAKLGCGVKIKREDTQPVFSFKIRGAYNRIAALTAEERARGVVACSAGNHAQGVAKSCAFLGIAATIVMPNGTPRIKVDAVGRHGGAHVDVRLVGDNYDAAAAEAARLVEEEGLTLIHPFDDPLVIAGQGTCGAEILRQTNGARLDAIFCCVGGGGLAAGVAAYVKQVRPGVKVYGVEAEDAAGMTASLDAGERVALDRVGLFADGAAVRLVGEETFRLCDRYLDGMITVGNDEICAAIKQGFEDTRCVLEPAGALALAGLRKHAEAAGAPFAGDPADAPQYVAIASGANMDFDRLRFVAENADRSEVRLAACLPETPGAFKRFYDHIFPCNVTEFSYRYHRPGAPADVIVAFQPRTDAYMARLDAAGYAPRDLTADELASTHVRHLAGGRSEFVGPERVFRFEFPEAPGALKTFLAHFDTDAFNCSLFHYRSCGHDFGRVLVGIQADSVEAEAGIESFLAAIGYQYVEETHNPTYAQFLAA